MGGNNRYFTVGGIARATISVAIDNWHYFLLLASLGWAAEEIIQLLTGYQHLFEVTASDLHSKSWIAQAASELTMLISFPISAAIALRTHAVSMRTAEGWRQEWLIVPKSMPALFFYAVIQAAMTVPFYLAVLLLPPTAFGLWPLVIALFLFLVVFLIIILAWTVVIPIIVIEQKSALAALRRSDLLTRYRRGTIFGAMFLLGICEFAARSVVALATNEKLLAPPEPALLSVAGFGDAAVAILGSVIVSVGAAIVYEQLSSGEKRAPVSENP